MRGTRSIGGVVGALLAITAGGIAVGSHSHPVGNESHPRLVVRQELGARAEAGEYLALQAYGRNGAYRTALYLVTQTTSGARAEQGVSLDGTNGGNETYRDLERGFGVASICGPNGCRHRIARRASEMSVAVTGRSLDGRYVVSGRIRDFEFDAILQPEETPHPISDAYEFWELRPTTNRPIWLYEHRALQLGARQQVEGFGIEGRWAQPRYESAARARYGHLDAWGG